jgi:hypothetical protein
MTPSEFAAQLLAAAQNVLPYIGAAVPVAVVLFATFLGLRLGIRMLRQVTGDVSGFDSQSLDDAEFDAGNDPESWR